MQTENNNDTKTLVDQDDSDDWRRRQCRNHTVPVEDDGRACRNDTARV